MVELANTMTPRLVLNILVGVRTIDGMLRRDVEFEASEQPVFNILRLLHAQ